MQQQRLLRQKGKIWPKIQSSGSKARSSACHSECGPQTSSIKNPQELVKMQKLRPYPRSAPLILNVDGIPCLAHLWSAIICIKIIEKLMKNADS